MIGKDVTIHRIWRPKWKQNSSRGRILNAVWMIVSWSLCALRRENRPDVIVLGTDPILSVLIAPVWRFLSPANKNCALVLRSVSGSGVC